MRRTRAVVKWAAKAPADRMTLPAAAAVYGAGGVMHLTGVPMLDAAIIGGVGVPGVVYGVVSPRSHDSGRAGLSAAGMAAAGLWTATAAKWGVTAGPDCLSSLL